jgi:hypothetical protein
MTSTAVLYGEIDSEMDDFDKIRERIKARLIAMGYSAFNALENGATIALMLEGAGVTKPYWRPLPESNWSHFRDREVS